MCKVFAEQDPARYESKTRSLRLNGQITSIRLETTFWNILDEMAAAEDVSTPTFISTLHSEVVQLRGEPRNFTSLLRCACVKFVELNAERMIGSGSRDGERMRAASPFPAGGRQGRSGINSQA
jgi:predicted DNA-binding ribbon-helix-helix protein